MDDKTLLRDAGERSIYLEPLECSAGDGDTTDLWLQDCGSPGCKSQVGVYRIDGDPLAVERAVELLRRNGWFIEPSGALCPYHAALSYETKGDKNG